MLLRQHATYPVDAEALNTPSRVTAIARCSGIPARLLTSTRGAQGMRGSAYHRPPRLSVVVQVPRGSMRVDRSATTTPSEAAGQVRCAQGAGTQWAPYSGAQALGVLRRSPVETRAMFGLRETAGRVGTIQHGPLK